MVAQTKSDEECSAVRSACQSRALSHGASYHDLERRVSSIGAAGSFHAPTPTGEPVRAGFASQLVLIMRREFTNMKRDKKSLGARMGMTMGQAIMYALIFPGVASDDGVTVENVFVKNMNVFGALVGLCIAGFFGAAQPLVLSFPLERPVFLREYSSSMYSVVPYFLAKTVVEVIVTFFQILILFTITFFVEGYGSGFSGFVLSVLSVWLMAIAAASMALWIGCIASTPSSAVQLMPAIAVPQILFSGLFIQSADLPVYLRWVQYGCALKYGLNLLCIVEFGGDRLGGQALLTKQDIKTDLWWVYVLILLAIFVGFRTLALITLRKKGQFVF